MGWYTKAANNGNIAAMCNIGLLYQHGQGLTKNIPTSIEWYTKAANQGHAVAQYNLGWIYQNEEGYKDSQKAVNWYQKAANNGDSEAKQKAKKLNKKGYYAKEEQEDIQSEEEPYDETIQRKDSSYTIFNGHGQSSRSKRNSDLQFSELIESRIVNLENIFRSKMNTMERSNTILQKELAALKQEKHQQHQENQLLKEKLEKMEAMIHDEAHNDPNCYTSDEEDNNNKDINYDTECSNGEESDNNNGTENTQQTGNHRKWFETPGDPNYDSSDNEDLGNDICLD